MRLRRNVWSLKKDFAPWNLLGRGYLLSMRNLLFVDPIRIGHLPDVIALPVHVRSPLDTETFSSAVTLVSSIATVRRVFLAQIYHRI